MITHIVMMRLNESSNEEKKREAAERLKAELEALPPQIDEIKAYKVGINFSTSPNAYDVALYSEFEDTDALNRYRVHHAHTKVLRTIRELTEQLAVCDYES